MNKKIRKIKIIKIILLLVIVLISGACSKDDAIKNSYPTDGLVAYFPFNGDWEDVVSPKTIVFAPVNQPKFDEDRNGTPESSLYFEGNSQYLNILLATNIVSAPHNEATIALWLKNDITAGWSRDLLAEDSESVIGISTDSEFPAKVSINYNYLVEENEADISALGTSQSTDSEVGVWTHLAYTVDSELLKLYINGKLIKTAVLGQWLDSKFVPIFNPYMQFVLGSNYQSEEFWRGNVDELFFYDKTLNDYEIEKLFSRE